MDKAPAQKLIQETLQGPFNKERFVYLVKNILNRFEEAPFTYKGSFIFNDFVDSIKLVERIGKYKGPDEKLMDILIVHLQRETSLERARTKQRNFVAKYLKGSRGGVLKDAALVAFVAPGGDDWRFSLVKMEYKFNEKGKVEEEFTPARRYSFLVGKNENSHTAQSRLLPLLLDDETPLALEGLENAFSVERVTKEFFEKYRDLFLRLKDSLEVVVAKDSRVRADFKTKGMNTIDFAKKLLGQIVFLYFLQKKGWFGVPRGKKWGDGDKHFLRTILLRAHRDRKNYFNDFLEPLFYQALRYDRSADDDYFSQFDCKIPFLNGGLFDPMNDYDWIETEILLSNDIFSNSNKTREGDTGDGVLDIFDRYNFTVKEDEPLEKDVAVDPEMLGKVFENLLEVKDRKSKGTYYTPREIVHYMCQESLTNYLYSELHKASATHEIVGEKQFDMLGNQAKKGQQNLVIEHRAEPIISREDIETLIKYGETVVEHDSRVVTEGRETERYSFKLPESIRIHAKLIDEKLKNIRVCDPAVGSGAFPVGMMNEIIRTRNALTPYLSLRGADATKQSRSPYHFKREAIQNCLYGVDIDPGAVEICKLRLWLSLVVDEESRETVQPLPNLDYKIVQGNSLLSVEKNLFNAALFSNLEELKPLYFNETGARKKQEYKRQIDDLISQITNGHKDFDFEVYFSEVFHEKKGFDVVIANPPYVKEDVNRRAFDGLRDSECYQGKMDLWYMFGCRGVDVLKSNGAMCFIATNNWVSNDGASKFRDKVVTKTRIVDFIDFGGYKIFSAGIQTMVFVLLKTDTPTKYPLNYGRLTNEQASLEILADFLQEKKEVTGKHYMKFPVSFDRSEFIGKYISFNPASIGKMLNKLKYSANFYLQDDEIFSGIDVMQDFVTKRHLDKLGDSFSVGDGVFVLSNSEKQSVMWNKNESQLLKPYYTTKEIQRYYANRKNRFWVLYTGSEVNIKISKYPNVKKHLDRFQSIITSVNKPYGLHRTRNEAIFLGDKILVTRKCARPIFSFVDFPSYFSRTFLAIKSKRINLKYLLGILNSRPVAFWLYHRGKLQGNQYQIDKVPLLAVPILIPSQDKQTILIWLVDKILAITKDDDYLNNATKQAKIREYEKQIDQLVYKLYGLTDREIKIVENHGR